uniref:Uncharacterized protein n=1 Tax=Chrysotila carterae TaxID=13221 RepID=A0A7S4F2R4_CHRCT
MVYLAAPEIPNADNTGCAHCKRATSRKWLFVTHSCGSRSWYCAGEKSKSQCRIKAKHSNAEVWIVPKAMGGHCTSSSKYMQQIKSTGMTGDIHALKQATSNTASKLEGGQRRLLQMQKTDTRLEVSEHRSSSSPAVLDELTSMFSDACMKDDAELLGAALMHASRCGLSLSSALSQAGLQLAPKSAPLPPRIAELFYGDGRMCMVSHVVGYNPQGHDNPELQWRLSNAFAASFQLSSAKELSDAEKAELKATVMHPADITPCHEQYAKLLRRECKQAILTRRRRVVEYSSPLPTRIAHAGADYYTGYNTDVYFDISETGTEFFCLVLMHAIPPAQAFHLWPHGLQRQRQLPSLSMAGLRQSAGLTQLDASCPLKLPTACADVTGNKRRRPCFSPSSPIDDSIDYHTDYTSSSSPVDYAPSGPPICPASRQLSPRPSCAPSAAKQAPQVAASRMCEQPYKQEASTVKLEGSHDGHAYAGAYTEATTNVDFLAEELIDILTREATDEPIEQYAIGDGTRCAGASGLSTHGLASGAWPNGFALS